MYKLSQYNYFVEYDQRMIYFNGITGSCFSLSKEEHENMSKLWSDLLLFHARFNSVFERFKEWGFIVREDIDEVDIIKFRNKQSIFLDKFYRLIIFPTEDCIF